MNLFQPASIKSRFCFLLVTITWPKANSSGVNTGNFFFFAAVVVVVVDATTSNPSFLFAFAGFSAEMNQVDF